MCSIMGFTSGTLTPEQFLPFYRKYGAEMFAKPDADAPLGFLLSGGLDSGLVCAISAKILGRHVRTFAIDMVLAFSFAMC